MSRGFVVLKTNESNFINVNNFLKNSKVFQIIHLHELGSPRRCLTTELWKHRQKVQSLMVV